MTSEYEGISKDANSNIYVELEDGRKRTSHSVTDILLYHVLMELREIKQGVMARTPTENGRGWDL